MWDLLVINFECCFMKVLVHGSAEATEHLRQHCVKNVCRDVYAPRIGETQDVTSDLCAYKVGNLLLKTYGCLHS